MRITEVENLNWIERFAKQSIVLALLTIILGCIGIMMLYSASGGAWTPWAKAHAIRFGIGLILMWSIALIPMRFWLRSAYFWYGFGLILLIIVEVMGQMGMGAQRWINLGGITIQPSEFMKLAMILALARFFHHLHPMDRRRFIWMIPPIIMITLPAILILMQPNLGTATILIGLSLAVWFAAGLLWRYVIAACLFVAAAVPLVWQFGLHGYQKQRVLTFLNPESDPLGAGYNIIQSIIAIGSGGLQGKGFVKGSQGQLDFLPEKHTDFIFTMLAEEFGFTGSVVLLLLFTTIFIYAVVISSRSPHRFGSLIAIGVAMFMWLHVMINMAMVMGLIPVVGVPLPFLSYGGTMLWATCMAMGLLQNSFIYRHSKLIR